MIFQSWLKDIKVHVEDWNWTEREAIQLVKDFTAKRACDEVKFLMGMITEDQQTFDGLGNHLKDAFQLRENVSQLISDFYGQQQRKMNWRMYLQMTSIDWLGRLLPTNHLSGRG